MSSGRRSARAAWLPGLGALLVGALTSGAVWASTPAGIPIPKPVGQLPGALSGPRQPVGAVRAVTVARTAPPSHPGPADVPIRLTIPALHLAAPVVPVHAAGGLLGVPPAIRQVGWWASGGIPGASTGTVVLDGHVDAATSGLGALWSLRDAQPSERITLGLPAGRSLAYRIVAVRAYPKAALPATVFTGPSGPARLVLITCGGAFNPATGHYASNVVVWAVPAGTAH